MRARDASGFVLVLVLAMLVVLSLLAGGIAATTARLRSSGVRQDGSVARGRGQRNSARSASSAALGRAPMICLTSSPSR